MFVARHAGRHTRLFTTTALAGFSFLAAAAAHAQGVQGGAIDLDTIVVETGGEDPRGPVDGFVATRSATATKTNASILETPSSISVVSEDQVEQQGAQSVQEALRYTPGVNVDIRPQDRYDIVPVRGFGGYQNFVQYLDGLRILRGISFAQPTVDVHELERIEVFRGPASVLYGQVTPGGLVNLVSKRPTATPTREVELSVGHPWGVTGAFDVSGPVNDAETFLYRMVGVGLYKQSNIEDMNSQKYSIAPSFTWKPSEDTSFTVLAAYTHDPESSYPSRLPAQGTVLPNGTNPNIPYDFNVGDPNYDMFNRKVARLGYEFEHAFNEVFKVRQNLRYTYIDTEQRGLVPTSIVGTTLNRSASHAVEKVHTFAVDNQAQAEFNTGAFEHTFLAGLDYQYVDANRLIGFGSAPGPFTPFAPPPIDYTNPTYGLNITTPPFASDTDQRISQTGVYLQEQARLGNLALTVGGRFDWYSVETDTLNLLNGATSNEDQDGTAFTWRAGLAYLFDNGLAPYASYATSFEPPAGVTASGAGLDPVTGEQYEVGVKFQPTGYNSFFMVSAFDLTQDNAITNDPANRGFVMQTEQLHTRGIEVEAKASLGNGFDVVGAYTYLDAEISKSNLGNAGNTPATVPMHAASLWAHYTFQSGALEGLGLGAGVRYTGETWGDDANTFKVDAFTLVDAALDYDLGKATSELEGATLRLNVANVFDEEYVSSCSATNACFYGTGRTFLATLRYKW